MWWGRNLATTRAGTAQLTPKPTAGKRSGLSAGANVTSRRVNYRLKCHGTVSLLSAHSAAPGDIFGKDGMRRFGSMLLLLPASAMLAACETATPTPAVSSAAPKPSGQMTADWSRVGAVSLTLSDFHFAPDDLELRRGTPYRLHLVNASTGAHTFTSAPFFKAIAVRRSAQGTGALCPRRASRSGRESRQTWISWS